MRAAGQDALVIGRIVAGARSVRYL
jgi:hypothetical protein